ncbi:MAG: hypothetical protein AB7I04_08225 [Pseudomonadales bacterium]
MSNFTLAVDWDRYKQLCDAPNVFSRWMLEQTAELVAVDLVPLFEQALNGTPLPKPVGHRGGAATDMFVVELTREDVSRICELLAAAVERGSTTTATAGRGLGGFREAWDEYLRMLDGIRVP